MCLRWFDLLTSFRHGPRSCTENIFWFFLNEESFISKTLNVGHVELNRFPASTVYQLAKKFESSQATAKHIKQVTRDPQVVQSNLLWHQHTELPLSKSMKQKKKKPFKFRQEAIKHYQDTRKPLEKRRFGPEHTDRHHKCGDSLHREGFWCPAAKQQCKICKKIGHFGSLCYKKTEKSDYYQRSLHSSWPKAHHLKVGSVQTPSLYDQSDDYSSGDWFCLQLKVKPQCSEAEAETQFIALQHLVTNLEIMLKPDKKRTKFLRARIDTYANVNLMPISVYCLLYKDPDCVKIASGSKSGISTYTTEKIQY